MAEHARAYHTYREPFPATEQAPGAPVPENRADWPKTYRYNSNYNSQGVHPPGQVWTSNQPASNQYQYYNQPGAPTGYYFGGQYVQNPPALGTTFPNHYYYPQRSFTPPHYYYSSPYSSSPWSAYYQNHYKSFYNPSFGSYFTPASCLSYKNPYSYMRYLVPGGPHMMPMPMPMGMGMPNCPATMSAQAAAALATNAALAAMPSAPPYWVGAGPTDFSAQQGIIAQMMGYEVKPSPTQLVPYKPADGQQFWCKELDGSWTLRTHTDIVMGEVSPGSWERHPSSGYFYWVRQEA